MTTIPSSSAAAQPPRAPHTGAHKPKLLDRISAQQQAGSLSATDADALTSAVQDIDQTISGSSGGPGLDPAQAGSRMDDLIGAEVDKGTLTSGQAATLKGMLSAHGAGGHGHHGGTPPSGTAEAAATGATPAAPSSAAGADDLLPNFLKQLQAAQGQAGGYGGSGSAVAASTGPAMVVDFKV